MKVAFYKKSKTFFGKVIRLKQKHICGLPTRYAQYSHVELLFSDGMCFSSSEIDGGVRFKKIDIKKAHWDICDIDISIEEENKIRKFCKKNVANSYNWLGIFFAMGFNINISGEGDYFCSQLCTSGLQEIGMCCRLSSVFTTPGHLAQYLENNGFIIESL